MATRRLKALYRSRWPRTMQPALYWHRRKRRDDDVDLSNPPVDQDPDWAVALINAVDLTSQIVWTDANTWQDAKKWEENF